MVQKTFLKELIFNFEAQISISGIRTLRLIPDISTIIKISLWPRFQTKNINHSKYAIIHFSSKASFTLFSKYGIILHAAIA